MMNMNNIVMAPMYTIINIKHIKCFSITSSMAPMFPIITNTHMIECIGLVDIMTRTKLTNTINKKKRLYHWLIDSYSHSNPPLIHSYHNPIISSVINMRITIWGYNPKFLDWGDQGNSKTISRSNIKKSIPIKKNLMEKGLLGLWKGVNPHS